MADGERTYFGAVAMVPAAPSADGLWRQLKDSRWRVLTGPFAGDVFTEVDRFGAFTDFDIALPGQCDRARTYGRQRVEIAPA